MLLGGGERAAVKMANKPEENVFEPRRFLYKMIKSKGMYGVPSKVEENRITNI